MEFGSRKGAKAQSGCVCGEAARLKQHRTRLRGCIELFGLRPAQPLCAFAPLREKSFLLLRDLRASARANSPLWIAPHLAP